MKRYHITLTDSPTSVVCRLPDSADALIDRVNPSGGSLREARAASPAAGEAPDGSADELTCASSGHPVDPQRIEELFESLHEAIADVEQRRRQALDELQQASVELAIAVASRIVREALDREQFGVEELVRDAINRVSAGDPIQIMLHPADLAMISRLESESSSERLFESTVALSADAGLALGSCRAVTAECTIVSDIQSQLSGIREMLLESVHDAQTERRKTEAVDRGLQRFPNRRETA